MIQENLGLGNPMITKRISLLNWWQTPSLVIQLLTTDIYEWYTEYNLMTIMGMDLILLQTLKETFNSM